MARSIRSGDFDLGDNGGEAASPHGEAALLLVEGLIHALVAESMLSIDRAVETVDAVIEVQAEADRDVVREHVGRPRAVDLLHGIAMSLRADLPVPGAGLRPACGSPGPGVRTAA